MCYIKNATWGKTAMESSKRRNGQVTIEYAVVAGVLLAMAAVMGLLVTTFGYYGERVLDMIASDYP